MRAESAHRGVAWDAPNEFHKLPGGTVEYTSSHFLYTVCRRFKYEIFSDVGRWLHGAAFDVVACAQDGVECKKSAIECLGTCGGVDGSEFKHDFATIVSLTELSQFVLGDAYDAGAAADCTVRSHTFKVPAFTGGEAFATFASRMRTRSGMTAISAGFCADNAASCSVIQNMLEKAPGLVFVNGAFRHRTSLVQPSPPPPPPPPPRLFAYQPRPPSPPPPPGTPPPYYAVRRNSIRTNAHSPSPDPYCTSHNSYPTLSRTPRSAFRCRD